MIAQIKKCFYVVLYLKANNTCASISPIKRGVVRIQELILLKCPG